MISAVRFAEDARSVFAASEEGKLYEWETGTGKLKQALTRVQPNYTDDPLAFSRDGRWLAVGDLEKTVAIWDLATWRPLSRLQAYEHRVYRADFAPDGKTLAAICFEEEAVRLWVVANGKERCRFPGHREGVASVRFSHSGMILASGGRDKRIRLWDIASGKEKRQYVGHEDQIWGLAFSPDDRLLASSSADGTVRLWDVQSAKEIRRLRGSGLAWGCLTFSPNGKLLAASDQNFGIHIWEVATGKERRAATGHDDLVRGLFSSSGGKTLTAYDDTDQVIVWDLATGKEHQRFPRTRTEGVQRTALARDGMTRAEVEEKAGWVRVWSTATERKISSFRLPVPHVRDLALSTDGRTLAVLQDDQPIRLYQATTGKIVRDIQSPDGALRLWMSRDNRLLAASSFHWLQLWEASTGRAFPLIGAEDFNGDQVALATDNQSAISASTPAGTLVLWEVTTGRRRCRLPVDPVLDFCSMALSPDGRILAAGARDRIIHLWDLTTGKELTPLRGHYGNVFSLLWSGDSRTLFSGSADATIVIWDVSRVIPESTATPLSLKQLQSLWTDLSSADAESAFRSMLAMRGAANQVVPFLDEHLQPIATPEDLDLRLERLIGDLASNRFADRQRAAQELEAIGELAEVALRRVADGRPPLETRQRVERLLHVLDEQEPSAERLQSLRALEVLEQTGSPEALRVLKKIALGAESSRLTVAARAAEDRLARRTNPER
jgi:WD40 repeat protein